MQKKKILLPIAVEGKYDKNTILQIFDATVITLGGFAVFNSKEKQALVKKLAKDGIILLTDSDGGGIQIRKFIKGILPKEKIKNVYIPKIEGKEKRKDKPSKQGLLGVEGVGREVLEAVLAPFVADGESEYNANERREVTARDFFTDGLSGCDGASGRRDALCRHFGLPDGMSAKALIEALNVICDYGEYKSAILSLK